MRRGCGAECGYGLRLGTGRPGPDRPPHRTHRPGRRPGPHRAPGDDVEVRLTGVRDRGTTFAWSAPAPDHPAVLRRSALGRTPTGGVTARFTAGDRGGTALTARRSCRAAPGSRCPHVVATWRVTVTVR
ncbi:hypothetical protein O1L55_31645 [Streptomyces albulus]|nr:hypothetical protein [Streptomyces noursei]